MRSITVTFWIVCQTVLLSSCFSPQISIKSKMAMKRNPLLDRGLEMICDHFALRGLRGGGRRNWKGSAEGGRRESKGREEAALRGLKAEEKCKTLIFVIYNALEYWTPWHQRGTKKKSESPTGVACVTKPRYSPIPDYTGVYFRL